MAALIFIGAVLTLAGIGILGWCVLFVIRGRRAGLQDTEMRARLRRVVTWNMGALAVSGLGLMCVLTGLFLA